MHCRRRHNLDGLSAFLSRLIRLKLLVHHGTAVLLMESFEFSASVLLGHELELVVLGFLDLDFHDTGQAGVLFLVGVFYLVKYSVFTFDSRF